MDCFRGPRSRYCRSATSCCGFGRKRFFAGKVTRSSRATAIRRAESDRYSGPKKASARSSRPCVRKSGSASTISVTTRIKKSSCCATAPPNPATASQAQLGEELDRLEKTVYRRRRNKPYAKEPTAKSLKDVSDTMGKSASDLVTSQSSQLDEIRTTLENRLTAMRDDNEKRLEQMRATVDEKLQTTLEARLSDSFKLVSDRLEQVHKGLGEMQTLAAGVGDLKLWVLYQRKDPRNDGRGAAGIAIGANSHARPVRSQCRNHRRAGAC